MRSAVRRRPVYRRAALSLVGANAAFATFGCGDDKPDQDAARLYPEGGSVPGRVASDLKTAAEAAGCELRTATVAGREKDGVYEQAPPAETLVHALEHGRVVVWFERRLPGATRANLKALFDADSYQLLLTPDPTRRKYQVAATAWNRDPDALAAFRDEHRGNGPEAIP